MDRMMWYVGVDWGSVQHAVCLMDASGRHRAERTVAHSADALAECLAWVQAETRVAPTLVAVAIETPRGAVVDAWLTAGFAVFAVNPKQLDRFRDRHTVAGAKDDRRDARVLADSLRTDPAACQAVRFDDPIVVQLRELSRTEDDLDAEFRRLANQLRQHVHRVAPALLTLCTGADEPWWWALLQLAPTPAAQHRLTRRRLTQLLRAHRIRRWQSADVWAVLQAPPFVLAPGILEATQVQLQLLLPRLRAVHTQRQVCVQHLDARLDDLRHQTPAAQLGDVARCHSSPRRASSGLSNVSRSSWAGTTRNAPTDASVRLSDPRSV
jgi:hypothetical protein